MIPILYESDETSFTSNGLGRLRDCIRCEVTEERNSIYEVEFEYPVNGQHFEDIKCGRIIAVEHDEKGDVQPFDIYAYEMPIDGVVTFHGHHISYRQKEMTIVASYSDRPLSSIFNALSNYAIPSNPFTYSTDFTAHNRVSCFDATPITVRQALGGIEGSILDAYHGEYEWDKFSVKLLRNRGQVRDYTIRYGVNMLDYKEDVDCSGVYTAVMPYWKDEDSIVMGDMQDCGQPSFNGRTICIPLDVSDKFEGKPNTAQVEAAAQSYMASNQVYLPSQNITIDFIRLADSNEYAAFSEMQKFGLCDSVKVVFPMYGQTGEYKIVKVVWDVLAERYTTMELGNLSTSLSEALGISSDGSSGSSGTTGRVIETGHITGVSVAAGDTHDYSISFTKTFRTAPTVIACFQSTSSAGAFGNCTLGVVSTTVSGATIRMFNGDGSARGPNIDWIAIVTT